MCTDVGAAPRPRCARREPGAKVGRTVLASVPPLRLPAHRGPEAAPTSAMRGVSLIEAVLFMVVVSVALASLMKVFDQAAVASADPVLRRQSLAIAQALLEEISFKDFANPNPGGYAGPYNAATRNQFDDVMDYNGLTLNGISDLSGAPVIGLSGYSASIAVTPAAFGNVPAVAGWRITVNVTDPSGKQLALDGYRADY